MTSEIKATDVWIETDKPLLSDGVYYVASVGTKVEKKTGMIVLTKEQFEKIVGDAFDAGSERMYNETRKHLIINTPDKTEYIATLLTKNQDKNDK